MAPTKRSCLMLGVAGVAVVLWLVVISRSFAALHEGNCASPPGPSEIVRANLKQIMVALYTYANAYNDAFPPRLSMLYPELISNPAVFWNPGDSDPCPTTIDNDDMNGINSAQVSFRYSGGSASSPPFLVVQDNSTANNAGLGIHAAISWTMSRFLTPSTTPPSFTAAARANLEIIGTGLRRYADDHDGHYPPTLSKLYPAYIANAAVFCNPGDEVGSGTVPPATISNDILNGENSAQVSFIYFGAGLTTACDPGTILVEDNSPWNNGGELVNILTAGSGVATYVPDTGCTDGRSCRQLALSNLKSLGLSLYSYANENASTFPTTFSMLAGPKTGLYISPSMFWNPGDTDPRPFLIDNDIPNGANSTQISYTYLGGDIDRDAAAVVLYDNSPANNDGEGLGVLTADAAAAFYVKSNLTAPAIETAQANLRQIGVALRGYADANGGKYPAKLSMLYPDWVSAPSVFWNPGDSNPCPTTINNDVPNKANSAQISYRYSGGTYTTNCSPEAVLVVDESLANNLGSGINVLTTDGTVALYVPEPTTCGAPDGCVSQAAAKLRSLAWALQMYADDNRGRLPLQFSSLYPNLVSRASDFWDPVDSDPCPTTINNDVPDQPNSAQISFTYLAAGQNLWGLSPKTVILRENQTGLGGRNVALEARADGSINFIPLRKLTHLTISGPDSVFEGHAASFTCLASYDDGTIVDVTASSQCHWLVSNGQGAFVERGQYMATPVVAGDAAVTIEVLYDEWPVLDSKAAKTIMIVADADADGVPDSMDQCPCTIAGAIVDSFGCPATIFGDADRDGDVDAADLVAFTACVSGPNVPARAECEIFDRDGDTDVDQSDFGFFQRCYSGENRPADPACAG